MNLPPITIVWCDISFENDRSYQDMKNEFNDTTTATPKKELNSIDTKILDEGKEQLRSKDLPLVTVRTVDDALQKIEKHKDNKTFVICSGSVGRCLVPKIVSQCPLIHNIYIFAHDINLHHDWADNYPRIVKMFNFPTDLLIRLTRDIAAYFIKQGQMFLEIDQPKNALTHFHHARNLEIEANIRDRGKIDLNTTQPDCSFLEFRERLDQLEGKNGLIAKAEDAIREQEDPVESA